MLQDNPLRPLNVAADDPAFLALHFLHSLFQWAPEGSFVELRVLGPARKQGGELVSNQRWFPVEDLHAVVRAALEEDAKGGEVYIGVNPRACRGGSASDVASIVALVADIDIAAKECIQKKCNGKSKTGGRWCKLCRYPDGRPKHGSKQEGRRDLERLEPLLAPSIRVDSGGGLHSYWLLKEPLDKKDAPLASNLMRRLASVLGSDVIADTPRILRLPGTNNHKEKTPRPVRLEACDTHRRYSPSDLDDLLPLASLGTQGKNPRSPTGPLPKELSPQAQRVLGALNLPVQAIRERSTGGLLGVKLLAPCPACNVTHEKKAWLSPFGTLKCWRGSCEASSNATGTSPEGYAVGLPLSTWVTQYAPEAIAALALPNKALTPAEPEDVCSSLTEAEARLPALIDRAVAWAEEKLGRAALLAGPPGLGKTREVLKKLKEKGKGTFLADSHKSLDEREGEAKALGLSKRRRYKGLLSLHTKTGKPVCHFADKLRSWADRGWPIRSTACGSCPFRVDYNQDGTGRKCPAHKGRRGQGTRFATHAHAVALGRSGDLHSPLFVDELPSLLRREEATIEELSVLTATHTNSALDLWCSGRAPLARLLSHVARSLIEERYKAPQRYATRIGGENLLKLLYNAAAKEATAQQLPLVEAPEEGRAKLQDAIGKLRSAHALAPFPPLPGTDPGDLMRRGVANPGHYPRRRIDDMLLALVGDGPGAACLVVEGNEKCIQVKIEWRRRSLEQWRDTKGSPPSLVVLDASAPLMETAIRKALPEYEVRVFRLEVQDPPHIKRVHLLTSSLTRGSLLDSGHPPPLSERGGPALAHAWDAIGSLLEEEGLNSPSIGIITHQPISSIHCALFAALDGGSTKSGPTPPEQRVLDELRTLRERKLLGKASMLHYGGQRGSNQFQDVDVLAMFGDPRADVGAATEDARALGLDPDLYQSALLDAESLQGLGRARSVRRSVDQPLLLVYVGKQTPAVWHGTPFEVIALPEHGRPRSSGTVEAEELARAMAARWGAASPALLRVCAAYPQLCSALEQWGEIANERNPSISNSPPLPPCPTPAQLARAQALPGTGLRDAFRRALGTLPEKSVADPLRPPGKGGCWRMREASPGMARVVVTVVRAYLSGTLAERRPEEVQAPVRLSAPLPGPFVFKGLPPSVEEVVIGFERAVFGRGKTAEDFEDGWEVEPAEEFFSSLPFLNETPRGP